MPYLAFAFGSSALALEVAPGKPTSLVATASGANQINLTWSLPDSDGQTIRVERSTNSGSSWSTLIDLGAGSTSYSNTGLSEATRYDYRIQSRGTAAHSWYSNEAHDTTSSTSPFPLQVSSNGRYLVRADGTTPFMMHGVAYWSMAVQLSNAQIDTVLNDATTRGYTAILFSAIEHFYSDQSPAYKNVDGNAPFASMTDFASAFTAAYWNRVDYIVNQCKAKGIVCLINPAYLGFSGTEEGWDTEVSAESDADLQTYGAALANRYTQGNIIWCMGGDAAGNTTLRDKQWNVITGIRTVRTTDLVTGHNARADSDAYSHWNGYTGFNLNSIYTDFEPHTEAATAWGRAGPMPFFNIEDHYENEGGSTAATLRRAIYSTILSGGLGGYFFGNAPLWDFGSSPGSGGGAAASLSSLGSTGAVQCTYAKNLFDAYAWQLLQPKTDTSLVTTALGSGSSRIIPAKASDGSFAMILTPNVNFTVDMSVFTPSSVRGRWYNPANGTYSTASGSPYANSGTHVFTAIGERVLVLDGG